MRQIGHTAVPPGLTRFNINGRIFTSNLAAPNSNAIEPGFNSIKSRTNAPVWCSTPSGLMFKPRKRLCRISEMPDRKDIARGQFASKFRDITYNKVLGITDFINGTRPGFR